MERKTQNRRIGEWLYIDQTNGLINLHSLHHHDFVDMLGCRIRLAHRYIYSLIQTGGQLVGQSIGLQL